MSANFNITANETQPSSCFNPTAEKIGETIAYCLLFVVSLAGNSFIVIIVYKTATMRKPINRLIANMAMSDLLYPIFRFPRILTKLYVDSWMIGGPLGQVLCKLVNFLPNVSDLVSIQSLVLIAVDRFGAVVFPLRPPLISSKLCPFFILATWIVAMAIRSPDMFAFKLADYPGGLKCAWQWNEVFGESSIYDNYMIAMVVIFLCIPLVLIAILYTVIVIKLKLQKAPGELSVNARQQRAKRERNVLKLSSAIVLAFTVCWLPASISYILIALADSMTRACGFFYFFNFVSWFMTQVNCAINPCICFIFSGYYRQGLKDFLRCF